VEREPVVPRELELVRRRVVERGGEAGQSGLVEQIGETPFGLVYPAAAVDRVALEDRRELLEVDGEWTQVARAALERIRELGVAVEIATAETLSALAGERVECERAYGEAARLTAAPSACDRLTRSRPSSSPAGGSAAPRRSGACRCVPLSGRRGAVLASRACS
jgi:hypothetical protein